MCGIFALFGNDNTENLDNKRNYYLNLSKKMACFACQVNIDSINENNINMIKKKFCLCIFIKNIPKQKKGKVTRPCGFVIKDTKQKNEELINIYIKKRIEKNSPSGFLDFSEPQLIYKK